MLPLTKPTVTVVGAGFSGLTTAYYLVKAGARVCLIERNDRPGGLLGTLRTEHGLVETAANGILNSARLEALCADVGARLIAPRSGASARYIWRGKPRRWPLKAGESIRVLTGLLSNATALRGKPQETIVGWGQRVLGNGATRFALVPALSGIYAGDEQRLSAGLIFARRTPDPVNQQKPQQRGTVAPAQGMQELIDRLTEYLQRNGAEFHFNQAAELRSGQPAAICTSASQAVNVLREIAPDVSAAFGRVEMLSLVTATCFYQRHPQQPQGFGCLFPREQGFRARGALFNDCLFEGRSQVRSETWIYGGALDPEIIGLPDDELR
ncbi:MAG: FAD-dependent oxidoreductase, partial [Acidobacteriota bacterium]